MALFNFGKKKSEAEVMGTASFNRSSPKSNGSIKVLGTGCKSCHDLYESVKAAVDHLGLSIDVEYVTDLEKVMAYGVMSMPAVVVNEQVVSMGKVLKTADIEKLLHKMGF